MRYEGVVTGISLAGHGLPAGLQRPAETQRTARRSAGRSFDACRIYRRVFRED